MDDVTCLGSETRIEDCNHSGWGAHNCSHGEDTSISCIPSKKPLYSRTRLSKHNKQHAFGIDIYKAKLENNIIHYNLQL